VVKGTRKYGVIVLLICLGIGTRAQDIHFSQFMQSPMNLNPALAGGFDGQYRFIANHRHQWKAVTVPYVTHGLSADASDFMKQENINAGLSIYHDKAGDSRFSTLHVNLVGAYDYALDSINSITGGLALGFTQRTIDYTDLQFDNQYNGFAYDGAIQNGEDFTRDSRSYANVNAGFLYKWAPEARKRAKAGFSLYNINGAKQSYFDDNNIKLDRRFNFHADGQFEITEKIDILPGFQMFSQGKFKEYILGTSARYILMNEKGVYRAFYAGLWGRAKDAGFISAGMDYDNWYFGVSYDINTSNLSPASNHRGALEISIIYIIRDGAIQKVQHIICPNYI
jgi:type IX secretion system PorP/SprF family membrane protein